MVHDEGRRVRVGPRLGALARAALPAGDDDRRRVGRCRPRHGAVDDLEVLHGAGDEPDRPGRRHRPGDARRLHGHQAPGRHALRGLDDGLRGRPGPRGAGLDDGAVGQLVGGRGAVGRDRPHRGGPRRAHRHVDDHAAPVGLLERGLQGGGPGRRPPAAAGRVDRLADAVVDVGDLQAAEAGVGDLVDLTADLGRVDGAVRPPPAEAGAHRGGRVAEQVRQRRRGRRGGGGRADAGRDGHGDTRRPGGAQEGAAAEGTPGRRHRRPRS